VKFRNRLGARIISEFIAALLGQHLGLPIPPISVVDIDSRLVDAISDDDLHELLAKDSGPHFGSEYKIGGYMTIPHGFSIPNSLIPQALEIFAFDMLIQNPDRSNVPGHGNPNLLFDGNQFAIFDHELVFSFVQLIGVPPAPWELRGIGLAENHIFYRQLVNYAEKHEISFENFLTSFMTVSDLFLTEIKHSIPVNWINPSHVDKIIAHLTTVLENIELFRRGLLEVFA
jgi:hypothetical protein